MVVGIVSMIVFGSAAACGSGSSSDASVSHRLTMAVAAQGTAVAPITAEDAAKLATAEDALIGQCMTPLGFNYWDSAYVVPPATTAFPYVLNDVAWARAHGYNTGFLAAVDAARTGNRNARYLLSLSPKRQAAYSVALNGSGPGDAGVTLALPDGSGRIGHSLTGCTVRADEQLYGDYRTWFTASRLVNFYQPQVVRGVLADPSYIAGLAAWSSCMKAHGTPAASPAAARAAFPASSGGDASPAETTTAVNEAECAASSGLDQIAQAAEARVIGTLGDRGPWAYTTERTLQRHALAVAH
jgi:hypothetical protein